MLRIALIAVMAIFTSVTLGHAAKADELALPIVAEDTPEYHFKDKLQKCAEKGINFAGHYTICAIGQSASFQVIFIIDRKTGEVGLATSSDSGKPKPVTADLGIKVTADSNLLVVNPEPPPNYDGELPKRLSRKTYSYDQASGQFTYIE